MTRYMIYFCPLEIEADNLDDAENKYHIRICDDATRNQPDILKIIPAEFVFDCEPKKEKIA